MDETSAAKGQDYVSIVADLHARRVLFDTEGRCADTVARFAADLADHGGDPKKITTTSSDMSTAFTQRNQGAPAERKNDLRGLPSAPPSSASGHQAEIEAFSPKGS